MRLTRIASRIAGTEKNILILVHPDMLGIGWYMYPDVRSKYFDTLKSKTSGLNLDRKFALLYKLFVGKEGYEEIKSELESQGFEIILDMTHVADPTSERRGYGPTSPKIHLGELAFNNEIGNYIIETVERGDQLGTVYIAGGYRGMCVDGVCTNFRKIFDGILDEPSKHLFDIEELIIDHPNMKGGEGRFEPYYDISKGWQDPEPLHEHPKPMNPKEWWEK